MSAVTAMSETWQQWQHSLSSRMTGVVSQLGGIYSMSAMCFMAPEWSQGKGCGTGAMMVLLQADMAGANQ